MTAIRPPAARRTRLPQPRSRLRAGLALVALVGAGLLLAGCGRKGTPEFDTGEPIVKSDTAKNQIIPGLDLPQKASTPEQPKKPKGNFVLDPLL